MSIKDICHCLLTNVNVNEALLELTKRTRTTADVSELFDCGGFTHLYKLLADHRFTSNVLSVLGNCTNVCERWRKEFYEKGGIQIIVDTFQSSIEPSLLCRCARLVGNLAKDGTLLHVLQEKFIINTLVNNGTLVNIKCQMACLRAVMVVCTNKKSSKMAADCEKFPKLLSLLSSPEEEVMVSCLKMLSELLKTQAAEVCYRAVESDTLCKVFEFCKHAKNNVMELAYEILFFLSLNSGCRVAAATEGALELFVERINLPDQGESFKYAVQSLCLCAREAVSRNKMKNVGALPVLVSILNDDGLVYFHESIVAAFVLFIFDDHSLGLLIRAGVIPAILKYLDRLTDIEFCRNQENMRKELTELESTPNLPGVEPGIIPETPLPEVIPEMSISSMRNEDVVMHEQHHQSWLNSSPETSPYYANSPQYYIPYPSSHGSPSYSPPHSPPLCYSPPHSPPLCYSPPHSPPPCYSPPHSPTGYPLQHSPQSFQPASPNTYSPPHIFRDNSTIEDDVYSDPLNDSTCSSKSVPYHYQSADGMYAMIHGTRGPIHDTLLLLSRFSQANDPSSFFLFLPGFNHILNYVLLSYNPKPKCARILNRLTLNSHCFDIMLKEKLMPRLYLRLCTGWSLEHLVQQFNDANNTHITTQKGEKIEIDGEKDYNVEDNLYKWKAPSQTTLNLGRLLVSNIRSQGDSSYGKGVLSHILLTGSQMLKEKVAVSLPHIIRSARLQRRVFWELKAANLLMDMLSRFPNLDGEMFILNVEAICALSHLIGISCEKVSHIEKTTTMKVDGDADDEMQTEPTCKRRKLDDEESCKLDSKVIFFKLPSGKIVPCDSERLEKHSRVFEKMLSHTYIDSQMSYILISAIHEDAFLKLIHFICGCQVRLDVNSLCEGVCLHTLTYGKGNASASLLSMGTGDLNNPVCINAERLQTTNDEKVDSMCEQGVDRESDIAEPLHQCKDSYLDSSPTSYPAPIIPTHSNDVPSKGSDDCATFATQLLSCSERFFVEELKSKCENHLMRVTCEDNVVDLFLLSLMQNSSVLKEHTFNYILTCIDSPLVRTKCFAELLYSGEKNEFLCYMKSQFADRLHRQDA